MKLLAAGHSHLSSIRLANIELKNGGELPKGFDSYFMRLGHSSFRDFLKPGTGRWNRELSDTIKRRLKFVVNREKPDAIALSVMGNEYNSTILLRHPQHFDFMSPFGPDVIDPDAEVIPFSAINSYVDRLVNNNAFLWVNAFVDVFDGPIMIMAPPPPILDEDHIMSFPGTFADRARKFGVNTGSIRVKMWRVYCEALKARVYEINRENVQFVDQPEPIFDEAGGLAQEFWQEDPTHANVEYGKFAWQQFVEISKRQLTDNKVGA